MISEKNLQDNVILVTLSGVFNQRDMPEFEIFLSKVIFGQKNIRIILDLDDLEFWPEAAFSTMMQMRLELEEYGGDLKFCGRSRRLKNMLKMSGFTNVLVYSDAVAAAAAFS